MESCSYLTSVHFEGRKVSERERERGGEEEGHKVRASDSPSSIISASERVKMLLASVNVKIDAKFNLGRLAK